MTPSPPINDRSDTRYPCWLAARSAQARGGPLDSPALEPPILARTMQFARSPPRAPTSAVSRASQPPRSNPLKHHAAAKSP